MRQCGLRKVAALAIGFVAACTHQPASIDDGTIIPLYQAGETASLGVPESRVFFEDAGETIIFNVSNPSLELYRPTPGTNSRTAVIIAPGGGFVGLAYEEGGGAIARRLAAHGVTAFVLKYRTIESEAGPMNLPAVHIEEMMALMERGRNGDATEIPAFTGEANAVADGARAVELIRQNADEWDIDPNRVGILGLSAGAFLAVDLAIGQKPSRPDFVGLLYGGLRSPVPAEAPPAFIAAATNDEMLPDDSVRLFRAWRKAGAPAELHMYENGGHGFDLRPKGTTSDDWFDHFINWMAIRDLVVSPD